MYPNEELRKKEAKWHRRQKYLDKKWRDGWSTPQLLDDGKNQKLIEEED